MDAAIFKTFITGRQAIVFAIVIASVAGCSARRNASTTIEEGVVINGVRWATRNADGFQTFVSSPEMLGGFYGANNDRARNRRTLRRSRGAFGNPCPPGWRLPTATEFESLMAAGSVWTAVNGVHGRLFGMAPHQLFLPAAGQFVDISPRSSRSPRVVNVNEMGLYWISMESEPCLIQEFPRMLRFNQESIAISIVNTVRTTQLQGNPLHTAARQQGISNRYHIFSSPFVEIEVRRFPELSVRCVAITADDE